MGHSAGSQKAKKPTTTKEKKSTSKGPTAIHIKGIATATTKIWNRPLSTEHARKRKSHGNPACDGHVHPRRSTQQELEWQNLPPL
jgi:hypothetical protein